VEMGLDVLSMAALVTVAKRPHDTSCLSVVSFNSRILPRAVFSLLVTSASDIPVRTIQFCCLRHNIEPCCHTHDSRMTVTVYSAWLLVVRYPQSTKTWPLSAINYPRCSIYQSLSQIFVDNRALDYPTCIHCVSMHKKLEQILKFCY